MDVGLFDFDLPEERIALRPANPRDSARLLVVRPGADAVFEDRGVRDLVDLLRPGDALVLNDTRVIPSRLYGRRYRGDASARVEVMLHKREASDRWLAFARPAKKVAIGETILFGDDTASNICELGRLQAEVVGKGEG
ncbi:S-adenosylmethionine:tRNA ribosyltransferase-isomerase, partial [Bosea sp. (in: a-proteobacteria)]|uniref:S-adenosylmethionine:tRNA ribosyltransferase-isomerase n=1 Tax=Bosea sp. (in: a-proteobacteria) TaxID=1871050 RepID=UPI002FC8696F